MGKHEDTIFPLGLVLVVLVLIVGLAVCSGPDEKIDSPEGGPAVVSPIYGT